MTKGIVIDTIIWVVETIPLRGDLLQCSVEIVCSVELEAVKFGLLEHPRNVLLRQFTVEHMQFLDHVPLGGEDLFVILNVVELLVLIFFWSNHYQKIKSHYSKLISVD